jgi:hypothetical protein
MHSYADCAELACACMAPLVRVRGPLGPDRMAAIRQRKRVVLVFERGVSARDVAGALDALAPHTHCTVIVNGADEAAEFQELIDGDRLFYLSRGELSDDELAALARGAMPAEPEISIGADALRRLALAQSVAALADALRSAVAGAVPAERTRCILFDREQRVLWIPDESEEGESAAVGLVSFIVRAGVTLCLPRIGDDPRYDSDLDGDTADRFLGVPVRAGGEAAAVLVALRPAHEPPFEPADAAALELLAAHAAPYVSAWLAEAVDEGPFRRRALRELELPAAAGAEPLRLEPQWLRRASWFAVTTFLAAAVALAVGWGLVHG